MRKLLLAVIAMGSVSMCGLAAAAEHKDPFESLFEGSQGHAQARRHQEDMMALDGPGAKNLHWGKHHNHGIWLEGSQ